MTSRRTRVRLVDRLRDKGMKPITVAVLDAEEVG